MAASHIDTRLRFTCAAALLVSVFGCGLDRDSAATQQATTTNNNADKQARADADADDKSRDAGTSSEAGQKAAAADGTNSTTDVQDDDAAANELSDDDDELSDDDDELSDDNDTASIIVVVSEDPGLVTNDDVTNDDVTNDDAVDDVDDEMADDVSTDSTKDAAGVVAEPDNGLWLYSYSTEGRLNNVLAPAARVVNIPNATNTGTGAIPWPRDASYVAQGIEEQLVITRLGQETEVIIVVPMPGLQNVYQWLQNDKILVGGGDADGPWLSLVDIDGTITVLGTTVSTASVFFQSSAPDGSTVFFSTPEEETGGYSLYRLTHENVALSLVNTYSPSPALSQIWSQDSRWFAFGISGPPDGGIYLWEKGTNEPPAVVSLPDDSYTPYYSFSASGDLMISHLSDSNGPHLALVSTVTGERWEVSNVEGVSPATWVPGTEFFGFFTPDGGKFGRLIDGVLTLSELPGYTFGCQIAARDSTSFIYRACTTGDDLMLATVGATTLETKTLAVGPFRDLSLSPDGQCLSAWSATALTLISEPTGASPTITSTALTTGTAFAAAPNGEGLAWATDTAIRWQAIEDCAPSGNPVVIDAHPTSIAQMRFIKP